MRKLFIIPLLAISGLSFAQAQSLPIIKRDTTVREYSDKYKVLLNHFGDNWFAGLDAGAQLYFGDHDKQAKLGERLTTVYGLSVGKWFSPGVGLRAGLNYMKVKGLTQAFEPAHSTGIRYDGKPWDGYWLENSEFNVYHVHADVLFNLVNLFGGYKPRLYNISPYAGLGWMITNDEPKRKDVTANVGLYNTFRLVDWLDLTLDVRGNMLNDRFDGETGGRKQDGQLSATLGLVYKFKKRDWDRGTTTIITNSYDESLLNELRNRVAALAADNDALKKQLENAKGDVITDVQFKDRLLAAPIILTFELNKWEVRNEARVNLGFFAQTIKKGNPKVVYDITGYADAGTGSVERNELLSRNRAEAIKEVLVNEFGVNPAQLRTSHKGGVENMYYDDPRMSRAVIIIGD